MHAGNGRKGTSSSFGGTKERGTNRDHRKDAAAAAAHACMAPRDAGCLAPMPAAAACGHAMLLLLRGIMSSSSPKGPHTPVPAPVFGQAEKGFFV